MEDLEEKPVSNRDEDMVVLPFANASENFKYLSIHSHKSLWDWGLWLSDPFRYFKDSGGSKWKTYVEESSI